MRCLCPLNSLPGTVEAHELIVKACTNDGPFSWKGKHYNLRYVNFWPKPVQKPHPPIWIPGIGSLETIEYVAKKRFSYFALPYFHFDVYRRNFEQFRECCRKEGYEMNPEQAGYLIPIHVAETDAKAREEYEPHLWFHEEIAFAASRTWISTGLHYAAVIPKCGCLVYPPQLHGDAEYLGRPHGWAFYFSGKSRHCA